MTERGVLTGVLVLAAAGGAKATTLGMKLFIMACAGLAGMYMVHLLAQDYNKYQSLSRPGRSVDALERSSGDSAGPTEGARLANDLLALDRILTFDPTGCARRYVCTVAAKSPKKLTNAEKNIIHMLRSLPRGRKPESGHAAFMHALDLGSRKKDADACAEEYPKCFLSVSQMLKLVGWL